MHSNEEWRDIDGYEGLYQVSNHGRVKSLDRKVAGKGDTFRNIKGSIKKLVTNNKGYYRIGLYKDNIRKALYVHRLVLKTFNPVNSMDTLEVNHINGNPLDNYLTNLEWVTRQENVDHSYEYGLCRYNRYSVDMLSLDGEYIKTYSTSYAAGKDNGIEKSNILENCKHNRKTAGGYRWRFSEC